MAIEVNRWYNRQWSMIGLIAGLFLLVPLVLNLVAWAYSAIVGPNNRIGDMVYMVNISWHYIPSKIFKQFYHVMPECTAPIGILGWTCAVGFYSVGAVILGVLIRMIIGRRHGG
jgi:hypothetical protein